MDASHLKEVLKQVQDGAPLCWCHLECRQMPGVLQMASILRPEVPDFRSSLTPILSVEVEKPALEVGALLPLLQRCDVAFFSSDFIRAQASNLLGTDDVQATAGQPEDWRDHMALLCLRALASKAREWRSLWICPWGAFGAFALEVPSGEVYFEKALAVKAAQGVMWYRLLGPSNMQLTGVSCEGLRTVATRMLKRSLQEDGGDDKRPRREEHANLCTPTFKLLAPRTLASAIAFSQSVIEKAAQGMLQMTGYDDAYPGTHQQVVTIESPGWEHIVAAVKQILLMVNNCYECIMPGHEERRLAIVMPSCCINTLIGVKGANERELQRRTGCRMELDDVAIGHGPGGDRAVNIIGVPKGLEEAIVWTVQVVQESHAQVWFRRWAERSNAERLWQEQAPPPRDWQVERQNGHEDACMGNMPMMRVAGGMGMGGVGMLPMSTAGVVGMWGSATGEGLARGCGPCESSMGSDYGRGNFCKGEMGGGCGMEAANLVMHIMDDMPSFVTQDPGRFIMNCIVSQLPCSRRLCT
ncbi:POLD1 [Symbiodinium sp. CCMP2456]|nr:POLD1 [Symbiodinium sp. CCMP2456]